MTDQPTAFRLTPAQVERLLRVHLHIGQSTAVDDPASRLVGGVSTVLGTKTAIAYRSRGKWEIAAQSVGQPTFVLDSESTRALDGVFADSAPPAGTRHSSSGSTWTIYATSAHLRVVLIVRGEWPETDPTLAIVTQNAALTLALQAASERTRSSTAAHRLARRLAHPHTARAVWDIVVRGMATAVNARLGVLALPEPTAQRLEIVKTYGYPIELVEHLRIESGTGVLGSVFESGRLLHVRRAADVPERPIRPRYRTASFVAVPIGFRRAPLGVICVADRRDDQAFTRADVSTLRALAAPAALALDRQRATARADRYARAATVDPLSGAFNRRYFDARLEEELQRSRRHPNAHAVALLMLDLDDFKHINDSYGHLAGDTIICDIAEILRRSVRVFDVCARFGGEEFAILMPSTSLRSAATVAARIRERVESYRPVEPGLGQLRITASIGLAMSASSLTGRDLVARADEALYEAKRQGKNRVQIVDSMATETLTEGPNRDEWR